MRRRCGDVQESYYILPHLMILTPYLISNPHGYMMGRYIGGVFYPVNHYHYNVVNIDVVSEEIINLDHEVNPEVSIIATRRNNVRTKEMDRALLKKDIEEDLFGENDEFTHHWNMLCSSIMKMTDDYSEDKIKSDILLDTTEIDFVSINSVAQQGFSK